MSAKSYILIGLAALALSPALQAQTTNRVAAATTGTDEKSFKLISERNIFNQSRSSRSSRNTNNNPEQERPRPVQVDTFSLVGTMVYEKGPVAFVVGSNSQFQKPIKPGDEIGGYKVESVAPNRVVLAKEDKKVEMRVGMQMKRTDGGEWSLSEDAPVYSAASISRSGSSSSSGDGSSSGTSSPAGGGSSEEDEILKRLMEKRAKELNR